MVELLIVVIVVALMLQRRYMRRAKDTRNLKYSCRPSVRACEPGEVFLVHSDIANPGQRNSAAIHIEEQFPRQLQVLESESFDITVLNDGLCLFNSSAIIPKKQQIKRSFRASLPERGEYRFAHAFFHAGDFLGIREYSYRMENDARIVIYPPRLENEAFLKSFSDAADEIAQKKQLLEDPISVCGYDPYTGREPLRKISWKQSAARGELIVKKNDPVRNQSVQILLDMQYHGEFECHFSRQEICFSIARAVCEELENRHIAYRFVTNAIIARRLSTFESEGGMGGSFRKILFTLGAAAAGGAVCSLEETVRALCDRRAGQELVIFITTRCDDDVAKALAQIKDATGARIVTLFADALIPFPGKNAVPAPPGGVAL